MKRGDRVAAALRNPKSWRIGAVGYLLLAVLETALGVHGIVVGDASPAFFVVALLSVSSALLFRYQARKLAQR